MVFCQAEEEEKRKKKAAAEEAERKSQEEARERRRREEEELRRKTLEAEVPYAKSAIQGSPSDFGYFGYFLDDHWVLICNINLLRWILRKIKSITPFKILVTLQVKS